MTDVLLLHHAQGLTPGVEAFADRLRAAGHRLTVPDLYEGATFDTVEEGVDHARSVGFDVVAGRGRAAADALTPEVVYIGWSLGVVPGQQLAQTRPGALGAVLLESCLPASELGSGWPHAVALQVHGMDADPIFAGEGDLEAARELVAGVAGAELFLYPGDAHLFADSSLDSYDETAATLLVERVLGFLATVDGRAR
ncbi:dienelactone hydrolase family protein [Solicola sp. PLA-1-18]|uniref:dienelactone hydrolase family protein n=1 Tax=Solicola sp. PLA-1-18 TaxID=3380532 RepID=UPI003B7D9052